MQTFIKYIFKRYMRTLLIKHFHIGILGLCIISLSAAFIVEYLMDLSPCPLCVYQRFPFLALICTSICAVQEKHVQVSKKWLNWYLIFFLIAIFLTVYHTGVERGIFEMSSFCKPAISIPANFDVVDFKNMLESISAVQCDKPALTIFALSMAEWNLLLNIFLFTLTISVKLRKIS